MSEYGSPREYGFRCDKCNHAARDETTVAGWTCPACKVGKMMHDIDVPFGDLDPYAWPGGYPIYYYPRSKSDLTGDVLCAECASKKRDEGEMPFGLRADIYYEGATMNCAECNKDLESAYGDPDEE